ncbi:MAG: TIGR01777 family oxidoreductase [Bacteroidia bacterium]|nr:TIGR01777 family oxidoreductase [Bacteroidia bacterium]HQU99782.1 TIGR01777 family oxidoreductase [Bacteroidia bacterium]
MKVCIAGGSGLIGTHLTHLLLQNKISVIHLSRNKSKTTVPVFKWDIKNSFIEEGALHDVDAIINLAGAGIVAKPWTTAYMQEIVSSRVNAAHTIAVNLQKQNHKVQTYIGASAIGFYGNNPQLNISENTAVQNPDFVSACCKQWEESHALIQASGLRNITIRIGIVLSNNGGALSEMLKPFNFGLGVYFGNGQMQTSWIHINDLCRAILFLLQNQSITGTYNLTGCKPVTNKQLIKAAGKIKKHVALMPLPLFVLQLMLGKRAKVVLQSVHVSSQKLQQAGFEFEFADINEVLNNLLQTYSR